MWLLNSLTHKQFLKQKYTIMDKIEALLFTFEILASIAFQLQSECSPNSNIKDSIWALLGKRCKSNLLLTLFLFKNDWETFVFLGGGGKERNWK